MAKKKKINQSQYGGKILGRVDEKGNKIAFIQNPTDEEDIAPVKQTNNTWFKKGTLDDSGYAIENPIDAINRINAGILMTGVDALGQFGRGFLGSAEGVTDIAKTTTADVLDFFGADNKAKKLRESAERTWGVNEQLEQALASDNGTGIDDMSFLGEKGKTVPQGLGTTMFSMTTGGLGGALLGTTAGASATSMALLGMSAAGNSEQEAIKEMKAYQDVNGFSDKEIYKNAKLYGVLSGTAEALTEMMFGAAAKGSKLLGIGTGMFDEADDYVIHNLTKRIQNNLVKTFTQAGLKATSEGFEEVASGLLNAFAKKITYQKDKKYWDELVKDENLLDSFLSGTFSAALSQAPGVAKHITTVDENGKLRLKSNNEIKDYITDLSTNEQKIADKVAESRFTEEMTNKEKSKIRKEVMDQLRNLELTSDEINKSLGDEIIQGEPADTLLHQIIQNENTKFNFDEAELQVDNKRVNKNATNVEAKIQQLANDFTNELNDIRNTTSAHKLFNEMKNVIQATGEQVRLTSYNELEKQGAVKLLTDEKGNPIRNKNGRLQYTDEKGNLIGINGFRSKDGIVLNSDSTRLFEATMGHEIGESIKANSQSDYKVLREIATELGKLDGTLTDETMKAIERTYGTLGERTDSYLDEYVNDKLGELFTKDSELINRIGQKPTILRKIIDEVKYLVKRFTTKSAEGKKLLELQHNLENKLQESIRELNVNNKTQQGTQYSLSTQQQLNDITNQRDSLRQELLELRKERGEITKTIPDYSMFKQYDELTDINKRIDDNLAKSKELYAKQEELKNKLEEEKEIKKKQEIEEINKKSTPFKEKQFKVLQKSNPMLDDYHTGIRQPGEIMTWEEAINDADKSGEGYSWGDYTKEDALRDLDRKRVTIYSSYPIKNGTFVTPSKAQAEMYAGGEGSFVYSKTVNPDFVAWINVDEGQYANVGRNIENNTKYSLTDNQGRELSKEQQEYFKNSKVRDKDGRLIEVYHGSKARNVNIFEYSPERQTGTDYGEAYYFTSDYNKAKGYQYDANLDERVANHEAEHQRRMEKLREANFSEEARKEFLEWSEQNKIQDILNDEEYIVNNVDNISGETKKVYLNLTNPLMVDAKGEYYFNVYPSYFEEARKNGNDGIIVKNVIDNPRGEARPIDTYIAFKNNQFKNVDNTNPTSNPDIRYSLSESNSTEDSQGRQLSEQQQEYFKDSKVRDENGNLMVMNHATADNTFTVFEKNTQGKNSTKYFKQKGGLGEGFYFSDEEMAYKMWNNYVEQETQKPVKSMKVYLDIKNPYYVTDTEISKDIKSYINDKGINPPKMKTNRDALYFASLNDINIQNMLKELGYDGIIERDTNNIYQAVAFESNQIKNVDNTNPTSNPDIRYSLSVEEANTTQDNEGRKLNENQLAYFKDSKAVDENGNLVTVYHTTTNEVAQFNEFNPVGTPYYRFGDQVVNYFSDSKDMSGSYASQDYKMADTKKLNNVKEAQEYLNQISEETGNLYTLYQDEKGKWNLSQDKRLSREARDFLNSLSEEERQEMKDKIFTDDTMMEYDPDYAKVFSWNEFNKDLQDKYKSVTEKYSGSTDIVELQKEMINYLENPSWLKFENEESGTGIGYYDTEEQMLKNIKHDIQDTNMSKKSKLQYEGYVNITNPYIVDAEKRNWNQVIQQSNEFIDELDERVPEDVKNNLTRLYNESANKSNDARDNYEKYQKIMNDISNEYLTPNIDEDLRKMNHVIRRMGIDDVIKLTDLADPQLGVSGWYSLADVLKQEGVIGDATSSFIVNEFKIPENVKYWLDRNLHAELEYKDVLNLRELYTKNQEAYKEFEKYRMPNYYFMEQIQAEGNDYLGADLEDMLETRAETMGADVVGEEIAQAASVGFSKPELIRLWGTSKTTNDVVKEVIASNKDGTTNYDGVIFKNVVDYGGKSGTEVQANDVYVTFNSNQFKAVDNLNPTNDADIRYQLGNNEVAPIGNGIRSEQIKPQDIQNAIAPLQEQVQQLTDTITRLEDRIAPLNEQEADELYQETQRGFENEVAPIRENLTPEENQRMDMLELLEHNGMLTDERRYEKEQLENKVNPVYPTEESTPGQALSDIRDMDEIGKRDVKAYQFEHPEVKPYFQEEARGMLNDLNNSIKGERFINESQERGQGTSYDVLGVKRFTSPEIAELLDSKYGYTYDDIRKGLNAIIEDHGAENIAIAKRIELVLDDNLRNGYTDWQTGMEVPPNQEYLNMLAEQEWQNYFDDINSQYPLEQLQEPQYNLEDEETDFSDVSIDNDIQNMTADDINIEPFLQGLVKSSENQAERQQLREELNQKREVKIPKQSNTRKAWNKFKSLFVNEFAVIDDYAKQTGNKDIKFKADAYNNYQAIAQANIETAQTDINGKRIGRSGNSIFEEAKSLGLEDTFDEYLKQWANVDRAKQGKGAANYSAKESYKIVKEMEAKNPRLKKLGNDMWQYYRNARHNLRDAGIINQDVSDMLGRMYPHYTPYISENIENYFTDKGELKPKATIKRAKGGAAIGSLLSAEEAMQRYTKSEFNTILGNDLYREIVNTSNDIVQLGGDDRGMQFVNADNLYADKNGYYLTAYEDGNPITARISEEMYETLTRETKNRVNDLANTFSIVTKPLAWLSNVRRNILTSWSPTFIAKNFIKDAQEAVINSKYTKDMVANYSNPQTWIELIKGGGESDIFKNNYGSGLTMGQFDIDLDNYNPNAKNFNFLKGIKNANELIELAPRYAEFKASRQNGCSIQEAMYNAREVTTNFSRGGVITKAFNKYGMTFLNSSVQGFDKFIRNFSGENGAKGIVNSLAKAAIFGIAPAVFNELAFGSGDDKDEEYEALPDYIKDNYYIIKTGDGNFIRIPKGRVLSVFGSAARRTIEAMEGEDNAFEGYWNNVQQQIGINNPEENNIFAPLIQAMGGRKLDSGQTAGSAWYGGDIIPSRLQKERPEDQYDASIDKLSIWLGQHTGISPYKINYVLDQYTGGMGDIFLPTITPEANSDGSLIAPIKDQFTADTITDNKYVSEFYDTKGKLYTGSKATDEDILKNKYMNSISSEMAKLYAERREVQADENLTKQQKYAKSQAIKAEINRLAKEGMDNYNNIITSNNYAKIGDTEYYKNANGQWTKVTDDVASLGLDTEEKNEYYKVKNDIYTTKKENEGNDKPLVVQDIINSNLTPDAKVNLYTSNYKDELIQPLVDSGMDVDSYLTFKSQSFTADKDSNGKSISGSKKQKVFDYINSMDVPYEQKLILAKSEYNSFNDNNYEIIEYIENTGMDYDERIELYKALGFKVDGDSISW